MAELAEYLQREMTQRGWSQREAAQRSHISKSTLTDLLNNPQKTPELKTLKALAQGFEVPMRRLIELAGFKIEEGEDQIFVSLTEEERQVLLRSTPAQRRLAIEMLRALHAGIASESD
jgi:transcriptional regulator with XRE-family HTH domain